MIPTFEQAIKEIDWTKLEKQHRILIEGNQASVFARRWFGDKLLFTAVAFLGTKAVDLEMHTENSGNFNSTLELDGDEKLTELNVAAQLETLCMIVLGGWAAAQKAVDAEQREAPGPYSQ
jgi:hypothetical protein